MAGKSNLNPEGVTLDPERLKGVQKAAIFLLTAGEEYTNSFFKELDQESIKKLGQAMAEISYIPHGIMNSVMEEYLSKHGSDDNVVVSGRDFVSQVVMNSLDPKTAREVIKLIGAEPGVSPFSKLADLPAEKLNNILKGEHPQTIALILSYLPEEKAAEILSLLSESIKQDVALRMADVGEVSEELISELDEAINKNISTTTSKTRNFDGIETLANILNTVDRKSEETILSHIESQDSALSEKIRQKMFVFEDLLEIEDKSFRLILQKVDNQLLMTALKAASEDLKEKVFNNLSERASQMLKEDMEVMGPVKLSDVEANQQTILKTVKTLEEEGKIVIAGKGSEDVYV